MKCSVLLWASPSGCLVDLARSSLSLNKFSGQERQSFVLSWLLSMALESSVTRYSVGENGMNELIVGNILFSVVARNRAVLAHLYSRLVFPYTPKNLNSTSFQLKSSFLYDYIET